MTDIHTLLPHFDISPFAHLIPSLEKRAVTCVDLVTVDPVELARRAVVPTGQLRNLASAVQYALQADALGEDGNVEKETDVIVAAADPDAQREQPRDATNRSEKAELPPPTFVSLFDEGLDEVLGGGCPTGYVTEVTGESGSAKTQLLLTLLLSVQIPPPQGLGRNAIYISTEAPLSTSRLSQLLKDHPTFSQLPNAEQPSLRNVLAIQTPDLQTQDHILRFQLPIAIERHNVGLVVIDSIAANFRAEFDNPFESNDVESLTSRKRKRGSGLAMADRRLQLIQLGHLLRQMAMKHNVALVVANQVADRFMPTQPPPALLGDHPPSTGPQSQATSGSREVSQATQGTAGSQQPGHPRWDPSPDPLALDHQMRWFTGWGDIVDHPSSFKTPSLGLVWANQIAARIALIRGETSSEGQTVRRMRMVFAPWTTPTTGEGRRFEVTAGGLRSDPDH